ncbi:MAG: proC [Rickettsiaceae bacterium]|nr:proC [Rickettsiaceae bacterium]
MGSAILKNLLNNGFASSQFTVLKPSKKNLIIGIKHFSSYQNLPENYQADIVVFAFKPQHAKEIISDFVNHKITNPKTVFISILAGKKISFFEEILGKKAKIIRSMPNLPTLISQGIAAYYANSSFTKSELKSANNFLDAIGQNIALKDEKLMNATTAISGSGPAYLFLFADLMIKAAIDLGLDKKSAIKLVKQTIYGSAKMALEFDGDLQNLIESVASKGGTTEAALKVFQKNNQFEKIIFNATKAAGKKSIDLSN